MLARSRFWVFGCAAFSLAHALGLTVSPAAAQTSAWPDRPVRLVVPYGPGGGTDTTARVLAEQLRKILNQSVVIENRAGAGSRVGTEHVARAPGDGYTFLYTSSAFTYTAGLFSSLRYDPIKDFTGVSLVATTPFVALVSAKSDIRTVGDLVKLARTKSDAVSFSSPGIGSSFHLQSALFSKVAGVQLLHVPYKSGGEAWAAVLSGDVNWSFATPDAVLPFIQDGRLRALAVSSGQRVDSLPDVPTFKEAGYDFESIIWYGVLAPSGTPASVLEQMSKAVAAAMKHPEVADRFARFAASPVVNAPAEFSAFLRDDIAKWTTIIREASIKGD